LGLAVLVTFSRAGFLCVVMTCGWLVLSGRLRLSGTALLIAVAAAGAAVILLSRVPNEGFLPYLNDDTSARIRLDTSDPSGEERRHVAIKAFDMFLDSPLLGHGTGASLQWDETVSSHNIYLNMAVDHGVVGPVFVVWLLWVAGAMSPGYRFAPLLLALVGLFSHNVLDDMPLLVLVGLMAARSNTPPHIHDPHGPPSRART
jgi:O-antigen ligase